MGYLYSFIIILSLVSGYAFYLVYSRNRLNLMLSDFDFSHMSEKQIFKSCYRRSILFSVLFALLVAFLAYVLMNHLAPAMALSYVK